MTFQYSTVESTWTLPRVVEDNIGAVALSLQTKAGRCLKTATEWKESWCPDPEVRELPQLPLVMNTSNFVKNLKRSMWLLLNLSEGSGFICIVSNPTNHRFPTPRCSCTLRMDTSPLWTLMKHMTHNAVGKSFFGGVSSRKSRWLKPAPSSTGKTIVFNYKTATAKRAKQHVALDPLFFGIHCGSPQVEWGQEVPRLKQIKEHFNTQRVFKKAMQLQGRLCIFLYVKSFLNAFKKYFSEDFMSRQPLERGSQDKGNCQISRTVLTEESLI